MCKIVEKKIRLKKLCKDITFGDFGWKFQDLQGFQNHAQKFSPAIIQQFRETKGKTGESYRRKMIGIWNTNNITLMDS